MGSSHVAPGGILAPTALFLYLLVLDAGATSSGAVVDVFRREGSSRSTRDERVVAADRILGRSKAARLSFVGSDRPPGKRLAILEFGGTPR